MTNTTKYTPGPWEVTYFSDCQLITKDVPPMIGQPIPIGRTYGENQIANARLIAAAPDMLAALQDIVASHGTRPGHVAYLSRADIEAISSVVIAKATGSQA